LFEASSSIDLKTRLGHTCHNSVKAPEGLFKGDTVATSRIAYRTQIAFDMPDGVTNTHVRKQIRRIRLSKGWTKHDLEEAAGIAADSLGDLEAGIRRINVDILRKIVEALESDITEVWPSPLRTAIEQSPLPSEQASDPLNFSRLAEIHSLTGAEASCMFVSNGRQVPTHEAAEEPPESVLRLLSMINLDEEEREWLCCNLLEATPTGPWVTYLYSENGRSLYLCLKNARLEFWAEGFIERCLSAWLASPSI
jgi:transcriptional regulator with XRE-family HTH domain